MMKKILKPALIIVSILVFCCAWKVLSVVAQDNPPRGSVTPPMSQVNFTNFYQSAYSPQQKDEWCWAACCSMIFAFHGHPVSQRRIVEDAGLRSRTQSLVGQTSYAETCCLGQWRTARRGCDVIAPATTILRFRAPAGTRQLDGENPNLAIP